MHVPIVPTNNGATTTDGGLQYIIFIKNICTLIL